MKPKGIARGHLTDLDSVSQYFLPFLSTLDHSGGQKGPVRSQTSCSKQGQDLLRLKQVLGDLIGVF